MTTLTSELGFVEFREKKIPKLLKKEPVDEVQGEAESSLYPFSFCRVSLLLACEKKWGISCIFSIAIWLVHIVWEGLSLIHIVEVPLQKMPNPVGWEHFLIMDSVSSVMNELREEER